MDYQSPPYAVASTESSAAAEQAAFINKVFLIMATGLAATGATAALVASSEAAVVAIFGNRLVFYGLLMLELAMVWSFASVIDRVGALAAGGLFMAYSVVNGLTLSVVFLIYTQASVTRAFLITAGTFALTGAFGHITKRDLSSWGSLLTMGLIGIILASIVNWFLRSEPLYWIISLVGVAVFVGLTAYDVQRIKQLNSLGNAGTDEDHKEAIHGALILYLDFINLFLHLLRFFGRRK